MRKIILILITSIALLLVSIFIFLDCTFFSVCRFEVNYLDISDTKIPSTFENTSIAFFSDIEYGTYFKEERLNTFIEEVNTIGADIIIFGGDLFNTSYNITENDITLLTEKLTTLQARLGKFAILGDFDLETSHLEIVTQILFEANFEIINEKTLQLHNGSSAFINLVGFNYTETTKDIASYYTLDDIDYYTISIIHGPSLANNLIKGYSDLTLSGHSHHAQINFIKPYKAYKMIGNYTIGLQENNNTTLYVTNGIGTTNRDFRINSPAEILIVKLHHKDN